MFENIASCSINCQASDLHKSFDNISLKPNYLNKFAVGSENKKILSISTQECVTCLIVENYGADCCLINSRADTTNDGEEAPRKKSKFDEKREVGIFGDSCEKCNKSNNVLREQLSPLLNAWFKQTNSSSHFKFNIRKLIPKNPTLFSCTYELVLYEIGENILSLIVIPLCVVNTFVSLVNKCYGFKFKESEQKMYAYVHHKFEEGEQKMYAFVHQDIDAEVPAAAMALVASKHWITESVLPKLKKWGEANKTGLMKQFESLVDMEKYSKLYFNLKNKYATYFISSWTESTDPLKFVYEDIAIATYLLLIWEDERERKNLCEKQSFIDIGCGNGLLVHILSSEGHPGKGVDIVRRKIWDVYESNTVLEESTILPHKMKVDVDWIVGNHTDELTPWIPIIAARSSYSVNYFVLPCCLYDFTKKYDGGAASSNSKYRTYLDYIVKIGQDCGFKVEEDSLRIPSTKRICSIGRERTSNIDDQAKIDDVIQMILTANSCTIDLSKDDENIFSPREVDTDPKNCTQIDPHVKEKMVDDIIKRLLEEEKLGYSGEDKMTSSGHKWSEWNAGDSISISGCAKLFNNDLLKKLKAQSGGLKSLLRNHQRIFTVSEGNVALRDFRNPPELRWGRKKTKSEQSIMHKVCACWFYMCHPQGCVLSARECRYMHGVDDKYKSVDEGKLCNNNDEK